MSALRSLVHPLKKGEFDASKARIKHRFGSWRLKSYLFGDKVRVNDGFWVSGSNSIIMMAVRLWFASSLSFPVKGVGGCGHSNAACSHGCDECFLGLRTDIFPGTASISIIRNRRAEVVREDRRLTRFKL